MDGAVQESDPIPVYLEVINEIVLLSLFTQRIKDLMVGLSLPLPDLSHIEEKMAQKSGVYSKLVVLTTQLQRELVLLRQVP